MEIECEGRESFCGPDANHYASREPGPKAPVHRKNERADLWLNPQQSAGRISINPQACLRGYGKLNPFAREPIARGKPS